MLKRLELDGGKYVFEYDDGPEHKPLRCLRYGEEWRDFVGDKAVLALFHFAVEQRDEKEKGSESPPSP